MLMKKELLERGITAETLNAMPDVIRAGEERYGQDEMFNDSCFTRALRRYPENTDAELVMMKIALIDMTNSTNLSRLAGAKEIKQENGQTTYRERLTVEEIVQMIVETPNFDERVKNGDAELVSELTRKGAEKNLKLMSFFSKYCLYHNHDAYGKDDYSIYDSVVKDNFGKFLESDEELKQILPDVNIQYKYGKKTFTPQEARQRAVRIRIEKMRDGCDYEAYNKMMGDFLELRGITEREVPDRRRKLDWYVWYLNRTEK